MLNPTSLVAVVSLLPLMLWATFRLDPSSRWELESRTGFRHPQNGIKGRMDTGWPLKKRVDTHGPSTLC